MIGPKPAARWRCRTIARAALFTLFLSGSPLGIIQSAHLQRILRYVTAGAAHSSQDTIAPFSMFSPPVSRQVSKIDQPDGSTRPLPDKRTTLFPPYMFNTAANVTKAEIESKEFRNHCRQLNPDYELITYDDIMSRRFIARDYPEWLELYDSLEVPVMRADLWRYLILHRYGGVYMDGDVDCKRPIDQWNNVFGVGESEEGSKNWTKIGAMVGIEFRRPLRGYGTTKPPRLQFVQWTMAGQPGHYIYYRTVELINETMAHIRSGGEPPGDAVYITGPVVFSRAVVDFMIKHGRLKAEQISENPPGNHDILVDDPTLTFSSDILVDNLALLHEDAFAYRRHNTGEATDEDHPTVHVRHYFKGSWKPKGWKTMH